MGNYNAIDATFTWDGDYIESDDGDIQDTSSDLILSIIQEVRNVVKSDSFDWEKDITLGANISDYNGEPNSREIGILIENRVKSAISNQGIVNNTDLNVRVIPVHANQVLIMIRIAATSTSGNSLSPGELIKVDLVYDTLEKGVFFLLDNKLASQTIP